MILQLITSPSRLKSAVIAILLLLVAATAAPAAVVIHERTLVDTSRPTPPNGVFPGSADRSMITRIWNPVATGCPAELPCPPWPLVLMAHGFGGSPENFDGLATDLAEAGYVVAAPAFPLTNALAPGGSTTGLGDAVEQPADLAFVYARLLAASADIADQLAGLIDGGALVSLGHSLGGATARDLAHSDCCSAVDVAAAVMVAAAPFVSSGTLQPGGPPTLLLHGTGDQVIPWSLSASGMSTLPVPRTLVLLPGTDHGSMVSGDQDPPPAARATATTAILDFLDATLGGNDEAWSSRRTQLVADGNTVVHEQCVATDGNCADSCTLVEWSNPPLQPDPDQAPAGAVLKLLQLDKLAAHASLKASGRFNPASTASAADPAADGAQVRLSVNGDVFFDLVVPADQEDCQNREGWKVKTRADGTVTYSWKNRSSALPPLCVAGSAKGMRKLKLVDKTVNGKGWKYSLASRLSLLADSLAEPFTSLDLDLVLQAQADLGVPGQQATAGACAALRISGNPVSSDSPRPFCKRVTRQGELVKLVCRGS